MSRFSTLFNKPTNDGLDSGLPRRQFRAVPPEEVAVAILGEMIQFRRASLPQAETIELEDDGSKVLVDIVSQASCGDPDAE